MYYELEGGSERRPADVRAVKPQTGARQPSGSRERDARASSQNRVFRGPLKRR
jgi:hypothetical protein